MTLSIVGFHWVLLRADVDRLGMTHVRLQQTHQGVPVLGLSSWFTSTPPISGSPPSTVTTWPA